MWIFLCINLFSVQFNSFSFYGVVLESLNKTSSWKQHFVLITVLQYLPVIDIYKKKYHCLLMQKGIYNPINKEKQNVFFARISNICEIFPSISKTKNSNVSTLITQASLEELMHRCCTLILSLAVLASHLHATSCPSHSTSSSLFMV